MKQLLLSFVLLTLTLQAFSQDFKGLITKEWKLDMYEESGEKFPPSPEQKDDRMIFFDDNTVKSIESKKTQNGIWEYNKGLKKLTITDTNSKRKNVFNVLKLSEKTCLLELVTPDGNLKMYLAAVQ
jgi:hypothetical protein